MRHRLVSALPSTVSGRSAAAVTALALGAVLLASCSSSESATPEDQIAATAGQFVDAANTGKVSEAPAFLCKSTMDTLGPDLKDEPAPAEQMTLDKVKDIKIDGDNATAQVTVTINGGSAGGQTQTKPMKFVNEDGWKACT